MKQGFYLIILQVFSVLVNFLVTFYVATELPPEMFAIIGVHAIISTIMVVFSNTGLETIALRNTLFWKENNLKQRIRLYASLGFLLRACAAAIIGFLLIGYAYFISTSKFNGEHLLFFLGFIFSGLLMSINDSLRLLLKSHNRFVEALLSNYLVTVFGKGFALILFVKLGFSAYIITITFLPLVAFCYLIFLMKDNLSFNKRISKNLVINLLKGSKHFAFSSYLSYVVHSLDQLLVSILLPAETLGMFTLVKRIFDMSKLFVSNFFDPFLQSLVKFKGNSSKYMAKLSRIFIWRNLGVAGLFCTAILFFVFGKQLIVIGGFEDYLNLYENTLFVLLALTLLLLSKIKFYNIATFASPKQYLWFNLLTASSVIGSFALVLLAGFTNYMFIYLILSYLCILFIAVLYTKKLGGIEKMVNKISI